MTQDQKMPPLEYTFDQMREYAELAAAAAVEASTQALRQEVERLRVKAERYDWLRSDDIEVLPHQQEILVIQRAKPFSEDADDLLLGVSLDEAIDKARAEVDAANAAIDSAWGEGER